jgi:peptidyl-prolyl cis-trans isomerase A (cyclophilin A)
MGDVMRRVLLALTIAVSLAAGSAFGAVAGVHDDDAGKPVVLIATSMGDIKVRLEPQKAPVTVKNFLGYVQSGFYDNTLFHRVIRNFVIQGGGFTPDLQQKPTRAPIRNEAANGLQNRRGTIAMARPLEVDTATSQFFINVNDNRLLDHKDDSIQGYGYAVFGQVIEGMKVVDRIAAAEKGKQKGLRDLPKTAVIIRSIRLIKP